MTDFVGVGVTRSVRVGDVAFESVAVGLLVLRVTSFDKDAEPNVAVTDKEPDLLFVTSFVREPDVVTVVETLPV